MPNLKTIIRPVEIFLALLTIQYTSGCKTGQKYLLDAGVEREYLQTVDKQLEATKTYDYQSNECNLDNKIYLPGKEFIYEIRYIKNSVQQKISFENGSWRFYDPEKCICLDKIGYEILPGNMVGMTNCRFNYYQNDTLTDDFEITGIIENAKNVWLHPPRMKYFGMLELSPYPYIKLPAKVGKSWVWELEIGDQWSSTSWKEWTGNIMNKMTYTITEKKRITTDALEDLDVFVIKGEATSSVGNSELLAYFNEKYGFVKMEYKNINGTGLDFTLKEVRINQNADGRFKE